MRRVLRVLGGLLAAFLVQGLIPAGFHRMVGRRMLDAADWAPGVRPPNDYMVTSVLASLVAAALAGVVAALIVRRARVRLALAFGALFTAGAAWGNRATLFDSPHPYEWPLILAPLIAMPVGAWFVTRMSSTKMGE